ncbi:transmembrane protease serine 5-like [Salvelinus namaycush]|uniref:Transmembrane protease serine 5-like n=1 Tax=Salvelinus namaycush TaxID=8040 RepID=A0A8U0PRR1_SALNM|nr:transmembrane protease serine 5-like [Salvelinus namaycush]
MGQPRANTRQSPLPVSQRIIQSQHKARQTRSAGSCSSYDTSSWVEKGSSKPDKGKKTPNKVTSSSSKSTGDISHKSSSSNGRQQYRYFTKDGMCRGSSYSSKNEMCDLIGTLVDLKYSWIFRLLLRPTSSQSPAGLGDTKDTSFCNVTEDISVADPRKECGTRAKLPRIIGGVEATLGRWPWQVSLYYSNRHTCGGTIITSQWVVTAAHCVHNYRLPQVSSWVVYAGIVTRSSAKMAQYTGYAVEKIIYNKKYNPRSHDNDIALMKLLTPLNFSDTIRPICLPQYEHDLPGGTQCWISGWGYTQPDEVLIPATLKEAPVPLISTKKCNSSCMYNGEVTPRMLCAGYTEGKVDACQGDSGGPLVCQIDNVWRLVGVVSWGTGCAEPNHPGVYTKVAEFLGWIYDMIESY